MATVRMPMRIRVFRRCDDGVASGVEWSDYAAAGDASDGSAAAIVDRIAGLVQADAVRPTALAFCQAVVDANGAVVSITERDRKGKCDMEVTVWYSPGLVMVLAGGGERSAYD